MIRFSGKHHSTTTFLPQAGGKIFLILQVTFQFLKNEG